MQSAINELHAIAVSAAIHRGWEAPVRVTPPGGKEPRGGINADQTKVMAEAIEGEFDDVAGRLPDFSGLARDIADNPDDIRPLAASLRTRIKALTGSKSEIVFEALPVDDPQVRQPDITRARQLLGWEPQVSLEDGLRRMLQANSRESLSV